MSKKVLGPYSLGLVALTVLSFTNGFAFAEVSSIQTNSESFFKGEQIKFSGAVEQGSQGLVTIVIHDSLDEFVMITQALINPDNTFEKTIAVGDKFSKHGVHQATGFILEMNQGAFTKFGVSMNGIPIKLDNSSTLQKNIPENTDKEIIPIMSEKIVTAYFVEPTKDAQYYIDRYYEEPAYKSWFDRNYPGITIEQAVGGVIVTDMKIEKIYPLTSEPVPIGSFHSSPDKVIAIDFVDPTKGAQYYIDRYYEEPAYKSWFDRNYPGITIEQAVGDINNNNPDGQNEIQLHSETPVSDLIEKEIIPEAEASPLASPITEPVQDSENNSDIAQISLAVAGLGILFAAVYGIKRKVDDNSKQISLNRDIIRKKLIRPIIGSNPKDILQTRLAKGEITLEEYEKLKMKLS